MGNTLTLYKMGATGRANLAGLVSPGVEFYTGERDDKTGVVTLTPVKINAPGGSKAEASTIDPDPNHPDDEDEADDEALVLA